VSALTTVGHRDDKLCYFVSLGDLLQPISYITNRCLGLHYYDRSPAYRCWIGIEPNPLEGCRIISRSEFSHVFSIHSAFRHRLLIKSNEVSKK